MNGTGRQVLATPARFTAAGRAERAWGRLRFPSRLGLTAVAASLVSGAAMVGAIVVAHSAATRPADAMSAGVISAGTMAVPHVAAAQPPVANAVPVITGLGHSSRLNGGLPTPTPAPQAATSLVLTAADHRDCPAAATACVDLTRHITWLQNDRRVTFGPVQMEPGNPAGKHQTPRGTFHVAWKAGPSYQSNIYHEAMPWATFFAVGGIAFHGGSLTAWSHGCVHITDTNAHYYNAHLPIGAEVVVF